MPKIQNAALCGCDADIARMYLQLATSQIKRMRRSLRSKSLADLQRRAHKLAGSSAFLGLGTLAGLLSELERNAADHGPAKEAEKRLLSIEKEFDRIQRQKRGAGKPAVKSKAPAPLPASLKRAKIFIVDDHPLICEGLVRLINLQTDLRICGQATSAHEALKSIAALKPDVVIVDITLAGSDGMGLIKDMKLRSLNSRVLVLSMHDESLYAERVLRAGAKGYLMKLGAPQEVLKAIHRILAGEIYLSEKMSAKVLHKMAGGQSNEITRPEGALSDRELQVFQAIGRGRGTRQIAEELNISPKTVESYRAHIKLKMNLANARELTQHAVHWIESKHLN
jgi:DNA-binding NarL/FixJ family response regulator/HPt (histidine-containing phosphotransfer) domain-containing protein